MNSVLYKKSFLLCVVVILLFISSSLFASDSDIESNSDQDYSFSLTISPVHLIMPIYEFTGEFNLPGDFGLALIAGYGNVKGEKLTDDSTFADDSFGIYEAGAQCEYYAIGGFDHGLQLGAEVLWVGILGDHEDIEMTGNGLAAGPFIGYKVIIDPGFTFNIQAGYQRVFVHAKASDGTNSASDDSGENIFLLNINFGWSF